jgi:Mce-associated membrane protein
MTPPRRRPPVPALPTRRPRVAGLRKPDAHDRPADVDLDTAATPVEPAPVEQTPVQPAPRARPTGKPREAPAPVAVSVHDRADDPVEDRAQPAVDEVVATDFGADDDAVGDGRARWSLGVPVILAVIAVVLGGFATWSGLEWAAISSGAVASNTALTDNARTAEVSGQITSTINTTFSYNYTDVAKTEKAAQSLLTGTALCQYNTLFKVIQQQAPSQKLVLTTTVTSSGVESLQGDSARVLMVVDQTDTRVGTNQPVFSQASLAVNAVRQDGKWKISYIDDFTGSAVQNCPK